MQVHNFWCFNCTVAVIANRKAVKQSQKQLHIIYFASLCDQWKFLRMNQTVDGQVNYFQIIQSMVPIKIYNICHLL
jgi:hypothetical protein